MGIGTEHYQCLILHGGGREYYWKHLLENQKSRVKMEK